MSLFPTTQVCESPNLFRPLPIGLGAGETRFPGGGQWPLFPELGVRRVTPLHKAVFIVRAIQMVIRMVRNFQALLRIPELRGTGRDAVF